MKTNVVGFELLFVLLMASFCNCMGAEASKKTYIIHMDKANMSLTFDGHFQWYESSLKSVSDAAEILYTYNTVIHGFVTRLTAEEAELLENRPEVLSVLLELKYELHTMRMPEFLGLGNADSFFLESEMASEVIVGVLDTGAWSKAESYSDDELGPVPASWKGECEVGKIFNSLPLELSKQQLRGCSSAQGVFVSISVGNGGPRSGSLSNVAPLITTVGLAREIMREIFRCRECFNEPLNKSVKFGPFCKISYVVY